MSNTDGNPFRQLNVHWDDSVALGAYRRVSIQWLRCIDIHTPDESIILALRSSFQESHQRLYQRQADFEQHGNQCTSTHKFKDVRPRRLSTAREFQSAPRRSSYRTSAAKLSTPYNNAIRVVTYAVEQRHSRTLTIAPVKTMTGHSRSGDRCEGCVATNGPDRLNGLDAKIKPPPS